MTSACPASSAWREGYYGARIWSGYGGIWRAPRGLVARVRAPVTSPMPLAAYLGARRPGPVVVLAVKGVYWRSSGILGFVFGKVERSGEAEMRGEGVEVERDRHGHGQPCSGRVHVDLLHGLGRVGSGELG
jgi:hypothetical protein